MDNFFSFTPTEIGLGSEPVRLDPVLDLGPTTFPQDSQPSTLASLGMFFANIGQTVASTYQALNPPGTSGPRPPASGTQAPSGPSTFSGGFGKLLLYAVIAFAVVFVGIRLIERR